MAQYEGLVTGLLPNGRATIVIRPDNPGIIDAPEISERVCHCATDSATIRLEAFNRAGAMVGDWVQVSRESAFFIKNAGALIGFPLAAAAAGAVLGKAMGGAATVYLALSASVLGLVLGVLFYRRRSAQNLPMIDRVLQSRDEIAGRLAAAGKDLSGCQEGCGRCMPWSG